MARRRTNSKINQLPEAIKEQVIDQIKDTAVTYDEISEWLCEQGYEISRSAVGRYALQINEAAARVAETIEQTQALAKAIERNPDLDYSSAPRLLMLNGLMQRISTAEEEFMEMPLEKAGRLVSSFSKDELRKQKNRQDRQKKMELAFEQLEVELMKLIKNDATLTSKLKNVLLEAKKKVLSDDQS